MVDKSRFIHIAPAYYAIGIVHFLMLGNSDYEYEEAKIREFFSGSAEGESWRYMPSDAIFASAVSLLRHHDVIDAIRDDFGPPMLRLHAGGYREGWNALGLVPDLPFEIYKQVQDRGPWILSALEKLVAAYQDLEVSEADFDAEAGWRAIPLDRHDAKLARAIESVGSVVAEVQANNGYAVAQPQERQFVLASLKALQEVLRDQAHTSVEFLRRFGFEPLGRVALRFKGVAAGVAALAATEALKDWVREVVSDLWNLR